VAAGADSEQGVGVGTDPIPDLDGVALGRLDRLGGPGFVARLIGIFLEETPEKLAAARAALAGRDGPGLAYAAHSVVSSAGNLGAAALVAVARSAEAHAEEGRWEDLGRLVDEMDAAFERVRAELQTERVRWQER
jgi:HPt (histidine-containing phosphotransfer) domain-containing protein